jgi:hypothetical protein
MYIDNVLKNITFINAEQFIFHFIRTSLSQVYEFQL